jgi:predicted transcriptional regulator
MKTHKNTAGHTPKTTKASHLHVRLTPEIKSALEELAEKEDRPASYIVRRILSEKLMQKT